MSKWWSKLSPAQKKAYIKKHPNSVYARGGVAPKAAKPGLGRRALDFWNRHPTTSAMMGIVGAKAALVYHNMDKD